MTRTVLSRDIYTAMKAKWMADDKYYYLHGFVDYYQKLGWDLRIDSAPHTVAYSISTAQLTFLLLTL